MTSTSTVACSRSLKKEFQGSGGLLSGKSKLLQGGVVAWIRQQSATLGEIPESGPIDAE